MGVGGHIEPGDGGIAGGLRREWAEEIDAAFRPRFRRYGLLNDEADPVGAVHLGIVFLADARGREVAIREREKLSGAFAGLEEVDAVRGGLESWSALLLDAFEAEAAGMG
ncbi:MAG: hypothetical protein ACRDQC_11140 [Gaiellales bacterium]